MEWNGNVNIIPDFPCIQLNYVFIDFLLITTQFIIIFTALSTRFQNWNKGKMQNAVHFLNTQEYPQDITALLLMQPNYIPSGSSRAWVGIILTINLTQEYFSQGGLPAKHVVHAPLNLVLSLLFIISSNGVPLCYFACPHN